ncbi:hypothetical protein BHE90_013334 [Fusarium euwallaceae]|uniref:Uncharacterized protein n=1 Tax=Fusarium euwallaceae TaxID=1147111 RepID=A0A430L993_9HYPO|nr:hypothetical protein BHE90_013334 [Fusarium euwallaceae]
MFVSITRPDQIKDRNTQKKINRHVMKPIGLARRRKPKNERIELALRPEGPSSSTAVVLWQTDDNVEYASNLYMRSIPSPMSADQELNYRHFSSRAHRILAFLREWDSPVCSMMRELSFTLAMMHDSAMHVALALTLVFSQEHKKHLLEESNRSLDHYNKSVSLVNQQITNIGNIVCDALIGVVIILACYDVCIFNLDRWVIHMTGLERVVELRGGFHKISSRYLQTAIICLTGSMMLDRPSFFEPAEEPLQTLGVSHPLGTVTSTLRKRLSNHADICTLLESMSEFATAASEKSPWTNDPISKQKLQLIVYTMLKLPRHDILSIRDDGVALYEIQDPLTLRRLGQTCKRYHQVIKPRIQQYLHISVDSRGHVDRLIRVIEPHLSIAQRKQLLRDGQHKGQQNRFPLGVDEDEIPSCASRVRQLTFGILPQRRSHLYLAHRYLEEAFKNMQNAEIVDVGSLTPSMGHHIASMKNLKALNMFLDHESLGRMYPLGDITNLQHLRVVSHTVGEALAHDNVVLSILFNSASTLRSLSLETNPWQLGNFLLGWEQMASEADWTDQGRVYLSSLKSLSLIGLRFNQSLIDSLENIIDFMSLDDLTIGRVATGALRLFPFLRRLAAEADTATSLRKLSLVMSGESALQHLGDLGADMEFQAKIQFIASFDTLTSLELKEQNPYPVTIADGALLFDALWRTIITHQNLESLSINSMEDTGRNAIPRLSAATVTTLINNLPKLRNFEFAPAEGEMEEIGLALSRGNALVSILCCPQPNRPHAFPRGPDSGFIIVTEILKGFLSRDFGSPEGKFVWEDYYNLRRISLKHRLWDVASAFGEPRKGNKKAKMLTCEGDKKRQVMYQEVPSFLGETIATNGPGSEWLRMVNKDLGSFLQ